jgi:hypothetical protein
MKRVFGIVGILFFVISIQAEDQGSLSLNFESNSQYYFNEIDENIRDKDYASNNYLDFKYSIYDFEVGSSLELYEPNPLLGYSTLYNSTNFNNYYLKYTHSDFDITIGNYYDQIGNGLIFRSYRERDIGINNPLIGLNINYYLSDDFRVKLLYGRQYSYLNIIDSDILGADIDYSYQFEDGNVSAGFGTILKKEDFTEKLETEHNNSKLYSSRIGVILGDFDFKSEFAFKSPDANTDNDFSRKNGRALLINSSYSIRGFAVNANFRAVDNFSVLSNRYADGDNNGIKDDVLLGYRLNYIPSIAKIHEYNIYNIYTFQTNSNNEIGGSLSFYYKFKRKTIIGGERGLKMALNYSNFYSQSKIKELGNFMKFYKPIYSDLNVSIKKRYSKTLSLAFEYSYQEFDKYYIYQQRDKFDSEHNTNSHIFLVDIVKRLDQVNSLKFEIGYLTSQNGLDYSEEDTKQHLNNWYSGLIEYSTSWGLSIYASNQYNIDVEKKNYFLLGGAYNFEKYRISLQYGETREGYTCVGGVCRYFPKSEALTMIINIKM